jgi:hypothetical protein
VRLLFLFPLLLAASAEAAELHADGAVDTRIGLSSKWDVVLHNRARVRAKQNDWYDVSLIPIFRYQTRENLQLYGGAFFTWYEFPSGRRNVVRPMAGVEPSIRRGSVTLASRTGFERFLDIDGPDYNRYRQRFRVARRGSWTPYASIELFFTHDGLGTTRYGAGARRDIGRRNGIEFFYWYEARDFAGRGVRHVLSTTLHFNFKGLAPDF